MSTPLAIASVTAVLRMMLDKRLQEQDVTDAIGGSASSTAFAPDRIILVPNEPRRLNLFMYQVAHNQGLRNMDFPSHNSSGERISNPPLAINLHYLLTGYGPNELVSEILLGFGMQLLHENPVLSRNIVRQHLLEASTGAATGSYPGEFRQLFTSQLAEQIELIKITPEILNTEEISRMWTAFQTNYRPTTAYQATVVLIESDRPISKPLPVQKRIIYAVPFKQPRINKILSINLESPPVMEENKPILAGYKLVLRGENLEGDEVKVRIGGIDALDLVDIRDTEIVVDLPPGLASGIHGVQVIHQRLMGDPPVHHYGIESNVMPFVLQPKLLITVSNPQLTGNNIHSGVFDCVVEPPIENRQRVVLLLNEIISTIVSPPGNLQEVPMSYSFNVNIPDSSPPGPINSFSVPFEGIKGGTYLARVSVDGAESPLFTNEEGRYDTPQVTIP